MAFLRQLGIGTAFLLFLLSIVLQTFAAEVPCAPVRTRPCEGVPEGAAKLEGVYVQDCLQEPCVFKKNRTVTLEMDIEFQTDVTSLKAELYALIGATPIKWNGINPEACQDIQSNHDCPLEAGEYITYGTDLFIQPLYPPVSTDVKFILLNERGETLICWILRAEVQG